MPLFLAVSIVASIIVRNLGTVFIGVLFGNRCAELRVQLAISCAYMIGRLTRVGKVRSKLGRENSVAEGDIREAHGGHRPGDRIAHY